MKKIIFLFLIIVSVQFAQKKTIEQRADSVLALMTLDDSSFNTADYLQQATDPRDRKKVRRNR